MLIWPAQFTHTHRGNPVYNCTKYVATGWIEYADLYNGKVEELYQPEEGDDMWACTELAIMIEMSYNQTNKNLTNVS